MSNAIQNERQSLLDQLEDWLETPLLLLGFVWLCLTVAEFTIGLSPFLEQLNTFIWMVFVVDFILKFSIAPKKLKFIKGNLLTLISLAVPALRMFRFTRVLRTLRFLKAPRGVRMIRVIGSFNRGMRSLSRSLDRRGFGYVLCLTSIVALLGAAGMYAFERDASPYMSDFGTALWWTAMTLTTMGADYFPTTSEGRLLCLLLALYGFAVFGYVTATVASFFVEQEAASSESSVPSDTKLDQIREELAQLRMEIKKISSAGPNSER